MGTDRLVGIQDYRPLGQCVDEQAIVNAAVGLLATGGSTNHAIHLPAIARSAGILIDWDDLVINCRRSCRLLAHIYPNGRDDVNRFQEAGGMAYVIDQLLGAGFLHGDILTAAADNFKAYAVPFG